MIKVNRAGLVRHSQVPRSFCVDGLSLELCRIFTSECAACFIVRRNSHALTDGNLSASVVDEFVIKGKDQGPQCMGVLILRYPITYF